MCKNMQVLYKRQTASSIETDTPLDQQEKYDTEFLGFCAVVSLIFIGGITGKSRGNPKCCISYHIHQNAAYLIRMKGKIN